MKDLIPNDTINNKNEQERKIYLSPSRLSMVTPIKNALRTSNNDVGVFLEKLEALNKMKKKLKDLSIKSKNEEEKENSKM